MTTTITDVEEWRSVKEGTPRVAVGTFVSFDAGCITLRIGDHVVDVTVRPAMPFLLDTFLNPRFEPGAVRAIRVRSTRTGWETQPADVIDDEPGYGATARFPMPPSPRPNAQDAAELYGRLLSERKGKKDGRKSGRDGDD